MSSRQHAAQRRYYQTETKPKHRATHSRLVGVPCATLSSKGQFTIPVTVRRRLGIQPGDRVEIRLHGVDAFALRTLPTDEPPARDEEVRSHARRQ